MISPMSLPQHLNVKKKKNQTKKKTNNLSHDFISVDAAVDGS